MTAGEAIELLVRLPIVTMKLRDFPDGGYLEALGMGIDALARSAQIPAPIYLRKSDGSKQKVGVCRAASPVLPKYKK